MSDKIHIYVEGDEDERFLKSYLEFLNCSSFKLKNLLGKNKLTGAEPDIKSALSKGLKVLVIFDADKSYSKTKSQIQKDLNGLDVGVFLFPDNQLNGTLEDLLEKIIKPEHKDIFDCFEEYKKCLSGRNGSYKPPDLKAKVYAYRDALEIQGKANHFGSNYWDFNNQLLKPLRNFLERSFS